jgi:hypothetical protein
MIIEITVKDKKGEIVDYRILNAVFPVMVADFSKHPIVLDDKNKDEIRLLIGYEFKPIITFQPRIV